MNTQRKICVVCAVVSGLWLALSAGVAFGLLTPHTWLLPIALLMGGSVVGIAGQLEKRFAWAAAYVVQTKAITIVIGMPLAYMAATNLSPLVVGLELLFMLGVAVVLFPRGTPVAQSHETSAGARALEEKLKNNCC